MSPSTIVNEIEPENSSPSFVQPEVEEDVPEQEELQDQNWLTIRRRCELCKQRKVCGSTNFRSFLCRASELDTDLGRLPLRDAAFKVA
jgi:hypothetical protein